MVSMTKKKKHLIAISAFLAAILSFAIPLFVLYGAFFNPIKNRNEFDYVNQKVHELLAPMAKAGGLEFSQMEKSWGSYRGVGIFLEERAHFNELKRPRKFSVRYDTKVFKNKLSFKYSYIQNSDVSPYITAYDNRFYQDYLIKQNYFEKQPDIDITQFAIDEGTQTNHQATEESIKFIEAFNQKFSLNLYTGGGLNSYLKGNYLIYAATQKTALDESYSLKLHEFNNSDMFEISALYFKTSSKDADTLLSVPYSRLASPNWPVFAESLLNYVKINLGDLSRKQKTANIFLKSDLYGNINIDFDKALKYVEDNGLELAGICLKTQPYEYLSPADCEQLSEIVSGVKDFRMLHHVY